METEETRFTTLVDQCLVTFDVSRFMQNGLRQMDLTEAYRENDYATALNLKIINFHNETYNLGVALSKRYFIQSRQMAELKAELEALKKENENLKANL